MTFKQFLAYGKILIRTKVCLVRKQCTQRCVINTLRSQPSDRPPARKGLRRLCFTSSGIKDQYDNLKSAVYNVPLLCFWQK